MKREPLCREVNAANELIKMALYLRIENPDEGDIMLSEFGVFKRNQNKIKLETENISCSRIFRRLKVSLLTLAEANQFKKLLSKMT